MAFPFCAFAATWLPAKFAPSTIAYLLSAAVLFSLLLMLSINVPFRAPNRTPLFSLDRFWQPRAWVLVLNLIPIAVLPGLII